MNELNNYFEAITSGTVNGYGLIPSLPSKCIDLLCNIASAVSKQTYKGIEGLQQFTKDTNTIGNKIFENYVKNIGYAWGDLCLLAKE